MGKYKHILFDLDGTIIDSGEGIINSAIYALEQYGIEAPSKESLKTIVGPPLYEYFQENYGFSKEESHDVVEHFRDYYRAKGKDEAHIYDGLEDLLKRIEESGKHIYVATSKVQPMVVEVLEKHGLAKYFKYIAGSDYAGTLIEKVDIIKHLLETHKITDLENVLMIGDREFDVIGAKLLGIDSVGVLYGYGTLEELQSAGATYIASTVEEILQFV